MKPSLNVFKVTRELNFKPLFQCYLGPCQLHMARERHVSCNIFVKDTPRTVIDPNICAFCNVAEDNEEVFGKMIKKCDLTVHYFCMLFSSGLSQGGNSEEEGIFGFMPEDIMKEVRRGARLRCTYCKQKGATIGCVVGACRRVFHFGCGRSGGTMHQYYDSFRSFCEDHRPRQTVSVSDRLAFYGTANTTCAICMTSVETRASNETLRAPCCRNSWFHRSCIVKHALTAGLYFFKCPLCNNKEIFQEEMLKFGVYLPDQDAAWETEPNAFRDLLERYLHCDARECHCPKGRDYNQDGQKWEIILCDWCGSQGSHVGCHSLSKCGSDNICPDCKGLEKKSLPSRCSTLSTPPPSSSLSPGTVLRLSYEETDDDVNVVDSIDNHPSTSKEYDGSVPSQIQQGKRKKTMKNTTSKRQKLSEDDVSNVYESSERMSPVKPQPTATITSPEIRQVSPVKSCVRQSALNIQAKRARSGGKRTRSVGLTQADTFRLERMKTDPNKVIKRSRSSCASSPKKRYSNKNPWSDCKGLFSRKRKHAAKKKLALRKLGIAEELNASRGISCISEPPTQYTDSKGTSRYKDGKGRFLPIRDGSAKKSHCATKHDILEESSTSSCVEDTGTSAEDSPVKVNITAKKKGLLRALLTSGTYYESGCEQSQSRSSSLVQQSAQTKLKSQSSEEIPKISKKAKCKKKSKLGISPGQMSITNWLTGMNRPKGEGPQTILGTEKGDMENDINFLNQTESGNNDDEEKSLIIKYKGKKFVFKKENESKSEKAESVNNWTKSEVVSNDTSPAQSTRQALSEKVDPAIHSMLQNSRPIGSSPALSTRQALMERRHGSVENRRKRMQTPKTFPRRKYKKIEPSDSSDLSDVCVYGTPRRSVRCSLNTKFQDNFSSICETDEKSEPCYDSSSSSSSTSLSSTSDIRLLYFESDDDEEDPENTSVKCEPEEDSSQCLIVDLEEEEKIRVIKEGHDSSIIELSETSEQTLEVMESDSTGTDDPSTSTYIIQSFGGNHGFQQLSISVPSV
ncbi:G2/M phase-specific E3 ubiquitin-protein ligase [Mizuhopecten yessoensis]|uniref:G2/M phase-specific E3 ubiquitin-protein ligase n=1 Tax=Mizuhopecten yessoensis TaxID=6573 RepID=A0A210Q9Q5_MIZYE|nr:G2/M phase-specific E3 ubiquitin-protein ligase [Mizuhopecten yessoensis]